MRIDRSRFGVLAGAFLVAGLLGAANFHLVSVSLSSQPACVHKEGTAHYRAAKPSC